MRHIATVLESQGHGAAFHKLRLRCPAIARAAQPGQFVHVLPAAIEAGAAPTYDPLLRRAFSILSTSLMASSGAEPDWFEILFRVGGRGTSLLARSRCGDELDVLGPLGNGFLPSIESAHRQSRRLLLLVGGGIGVPPLIFTAQTVAALQGGSSSEVEAFIGARNQSELIGVEALTAAGARLHIATDDGSSGVRGLVTQPLRHRLREIAKDGAALRPLVCACGPWPMLKAVARLCAEENAECLVSLEENMPCGVGVCNGCVVPMLDAPDDYGKFQRICVHGPVLDARTVDWGDASVHFSGTAQPARPETATETPEHQGASQ